MVVVEGRGEERKTESKENKRKLRRAAGSREREREMRKWREIEKVEVLPKTGCGGEMVVEGSCKEMRREKVGRKREHLAKENAN